MDKEREQYLQERTKKPRNFLPSQKEYEQYLNEFYWGTYNLQQTFEQFGHWFTEGVAYEKIMKYYFKQQIGTLHRKKDPVGFYAGYNDWTNK